MDNEITQTETAEPIKRMPNLPIALGATVVVAILMTCLSVGVYYMSGYYKFDLSRPGYEAERQGVTSSNTPVTYDTSSPITADALNSFLSAYDTNVGSVNSIGDFSDGSVLSDETLQLQDNPSQ